MWSWDNWENPMTHNQHLVDYESKNPSKVTLDKVQPSARCLFSTKSNFITLYISAAGCSSHQEWFSLCYVQVKLNLMAVFITSAKLDGLICTLWLLLSFFEKCAPWPWRRNFTSSWLHVYLQFIFVMLSFPSMRNVWISEPTSVSLYP